MKLAKILHILMISSTLSVGLIASYSLANVDNTNPSAQVELKSKYSNLVYFDAVAVKEATKQLEKATSALKAAESAKDEVKEGKFFQAARSSMAVAADAVNAHAIARAADAINNFTRAVKAASTAVTEEEEQKYIHAAQAAIEDFKVALANPEL